MLDWGFSGEPARGRGASFCRVMRQPRKTHRMQQAGVTSVVTGTQPLRPAHGLGSQLCSFVRSRTVGHCLIYLVRASVSAFVKYRFYIRTYSSREL